MTVDEAVLKIFKVLKVRKGNVTMSKKDRWLTISNGLYVGDGGKRSVTNVRPDELIQKLGVPWPINKSFIGSLFSNIQSKEPVVMLVEDDKGKTVEVLIDTIRIKKLIWAAPEAILSNAVKKELTAIFVNASYNKL